MAIAFLIGRVIFGLYWLHSAYGHLVKTGNLVGYASSKGVKAPKLAIIGSGLLLLGGGLSMLLGVWPTVGVALLVVFLLGVSFKMHSYWATQDPMQRAGEKIDFWKNMALLAALLMLLAIPQPWEYSLAL